MKPTEVQIISIKENANKLGRNENHSFEKNEVFASEDAIGHKKYTIRADRMYRAECRSKGSRPLATTEWYLLKKNQRYNVGQPMDSTDATAASSSPNVLSEDIQKSSNTILVEGTIAGLVETQQVSEIYFSLRNSQENWKIEVTTFMREKNLNDNGADYFSPR